MPILISTLSMCDYLRITSILAEEVKIELKSYGSIDELIKKE